MNCSAHNLLTHAEQTIVKTRPYGVRARQIHEISQLVAVSKTFGVYFFIHSLSSLCIPTNSHTYLYVCAG